MKTYLLVLTLFICTSMFGQRFLTPSFSVLPTENILYGENTNYLGNTEELFLDFYEPENDTMAYRPLLIYAHGGGFTDTAQSKDLVHIEAYCDSLAARGYAVASINYRLDSAIHNRAMMNAMHDMKAAVRFFKLHAEDYGINSNLIIVAGESAGAVTALNTAYTNSPSEVHFPASPPFVTDDSVEGSSGNFGINSSVKAVLSLCGGAETSLNNPLFFTENINSEDEPPLVMVHGVEDTFVPIEDALSVAIQAEEIGVPNLFYTMPGADHCPWFWPLENSWEYMDTLISYTVPFMHTCVTEFTNSTAELSAENQVAFYPNPAGEKIEMTVEVKNALIL